METTKIMINRTVMCYNHQGKGDHYIKAMTLRGYDHVKRIDARVVFMDIDTPLRVSRHRSLLASGKQALFTYPHAARPNIAWDGLFVGSRYTKATFVCAQGHIDVMQAYGYDKPIHVAGWAYCPMLPFVPNDNPRKVLFAPIHPCKNNYLSQIDKRINDGAFQRLLQLVDRGHIELTVRYIRGIQNNGIWNDERVTYIEGATDLTYKEVDEADVVVGSQTIAYIALARGKPVLMMGEDIAPRNGGSDETFQYVSSWDKYRDKLMYPLDILYTDDTMGLIQRAALSDKRVSEWKERMIGNPFDYKFVADTVESYLQA